MECTTACALIETITYKPGWRFEAHDHSDRFEGSITLTVHYPALRSEREFWPTFPEDIVTRATYALVVRDCCEEDLLRQVMDAIIDVEQHEAREFFRIHPTGWAPFHPHKVDGMKRWGTLEQDMKFGIA